MSGFLIIFADDRLDPGRKTPRPNAVIGEPFVGIHAFAWDEIASVLISREGNATRVVIERKNKPTVGCWTITEPAIIAQQLTQ